MYEEKITGIIKQVDRLDELLQQLLQLARIESGTTVAQKEAIALSGLIAALNEKWKESAAAKQISIETDVPAHASIYGDKLFLEIILTNLVINAINYGKENGHIILQWHVQSNTLTISDDGHGIDPTHLPNIFNRFYRADEARSSTVKGSGLGLSIVKKLADLQDILLQAESKPGVGSSFTLQFPR